MHNCRDSFLNAITHCTCGAGAAHRAVGNVNFFMNVPVTPLGGLTFEDGISAPGKCGDARGDGRHGADLELPQLNNPCNGYNPTPVRLTIWEAE